MDERPAWTDCEEAGDYVVPNVLSPRDIVSRPDNMDETVPHTRMPALSFKQFYDDAWTELVNHYANRTLKIVSCTKGYTLI